MRKALVNDIIRSFAYCCRTGERNWPWPILGMSLPVSGEGAVTRAEQAAIIEVATWLQSNYILAMRQITLTIATFRSLSQEEKDYAIYLLRTYYGLRPC
jgi:hypothetical protein